MLGVEALIVFAVASFHFAVVPRRKRTPKRDKEYEIFFCHRRHIDGKRLPSTMYARTYID